MNDLVLAFAADYGVPLLFVVTFLSCLALPVPSSLLMLASGGFAATGDISIVMAAVAAFAGAVLGDNTGYYLAHRFGGRLERWLTGRPKRAALKKRAAEYMDRWGGMSVFFSRWLVAPLGPYVNYASGLAGFRWSRFAAWSAAGELVWVTSYIGLGYVFADNIAAVSALLGNISGLLAASVVAGGLSLWLIRASKQREAKRQNTGKGSGKR
ncbi:DedA family protein [Yoonia litorea]|uniref:Membrane protein DedA, SNARE-associated domain n=1 Tax=Yoonia litorea TaxID=1123755 RepID=A0A1I6LYW9_9RHOB|nr:DedA family protein [Yoonia litorea]SFS08574.1 membrane protein DedA, SNARE-associated domain [Yoonia litorea]